MLRIVQSGSIIRVENIIYRSISRHDNEDFQKKVDDAKKDDEKKYISKKFLEETISKSDSLNKQLKSSFNFLKSEGLENENIYIQLNNDDLNNLEQLVKTDNKNIKQNINKDNSNNKLDFDNFDLKSFDSNQKFIDKNLSKTICIITPNQYNKSIPQGIRPNVVRTNLKNLSSQNILNDEIAQSIDKSLVQAVFESLESLIGKVEIINPASEENEFMGKNEDLNNDLELLNQEFSINENNYLDNKFDIEAKPELLENKHKTDENNVSVDKPIVKELFKNNIIPEKSVINKTESTINNQLNDLDINLNSDLLDSNTTESEPKSLNKSDNHLNSIKPIVKDSFKNNTNPEKSVINKAESTINNQLNNLDITPNSDLLDSNTTDNIKSEPKSLNKSDNNNSIKTIIREPLKNNTNPEKLVINKAESTINNKLNNLDITPNSDLLDSNTINNIKSEPKSLNKSDNNNSIKTIIREPLKNNTNPEKSVINKTEVPNNNQLNHLDISLNSDLLDSNTTYNIKSEPESLNKTNINNSIKPIVKDSFKNNTNPEKSVINKTEVPNNNQLNHLDINLNSDLLDSNTTYNIKSEPESLNKTNNNNSIKNIVKDSFKNNTNPEKSVINKTEVPNNNQLNHLDISLNSDLLDSNTTDNIKSEPKSLNKSNNNNSIKTIIKEPLKNNTNPEKLVINKAESTINTHFNNLDINLNSDLLDSNTTYNIKSEPEPLNKSENQLNSIKTIVKEPLKNNIIPEKLVINKAESTINTHFNDLDINLNSGLLDSKTTDNIKSALKSKTNEELPENISYDNILVNEKIKNSALNNKIDSNTNLDKNIEKILLNLNNKIKEYFPLKVFNPETIKAIIPNISKLNESNKEKYFNKLTKLISNEVTLIGKQVINDVFYDKNNIDLINNKIEKSTSNNLRNNIDNTLKSDILPILKNVFDDNYKIIKTSLDTLLRQPENYLTKEEKLNILKGKNSNSKEKPIINKEKLGLFLLDNIKETINISLDSLKNPIKNDLGSDISSIKNKNEDKIKTLKFISKAIDKVENKYNNINDLNNLKNYFENNYNKEDMNKSLKNIVKSDESIILNKNISSEIEKPFVSDNDLKLNSIIPNLISAIKDNGNEIVDRKKHELYPKITYFFIKTAEKILTDQGLSRNEINKDINSIFSELLINKKLPVTSLSTKSNDKNINSSIIEFLEDFSFQNKNYLDKKFPLKDKGKNENKKIEGKDDLSNNIINTSIKSEIEFEKSILEEKENELKNYNKKITLNNTNNNDLYNSEQYQEELYQKEELYNEQTKEKFEEMVELFEFYFDVFIKESKESTIINKPKIENIEPDKILNDKINPEKLTGNILKSIFSKDSLFNTNKLFFENSNDELPIVLDKNISNDLTNSEIKNNLFKPNQKQFNTEIKIINKDDLFNNLENDNDLGGNKVENNDFNDNKKIKSTDEKSVNNLINSSQLIKYINEGVELNFSQIPEVIKDVIVNYTSTAPITISLKLKPTNMSEIDVTFKLTEGKQMSIIFETSSLATQKIVESYFASIKNIVTENYLVLQELSSSVSQIVSKPIQNKNSNFSNKGFSKDSDEKPSSFQNLRRNGRKHSDNEGETEEELKVDI
ncbi:MAG: hypothetical protein U0457_00565 [Candidatus Sericytochromatia bacterium]